MKWPAWPKGNVGQTRHVLLHRPKKSDIKAKTKTINHRKKIIPTVLLLLAITIAYYHAVPKRITVEDKRIIALYLPDTSRSQIDFAGEIELIARAQATVLAHNPPGKAIPKQQHRQPVDLYAHGEGLCYDRAYTLAKIYRYLGFQTRHVALYRNDPTKVNWRELLQKDIKSHAALEVKTSRGWMIVEPDTNWLGLAADSIPLCYFEVSNQNIAWLKEPPETSNWHLQQEAIQVYGLYSRHGKFFPPFNLVPDVNWQELLWNVRREGKKAT